MKTLEQLYKKYKRYIREDCNIAYDENENIYQIMWRDDDLMICLVAPHSGNNYCFLLRINPIWNFDKWGNTDIEYRYKDLKKLSYDLFKDNYWIYQHLYRLYGERYLELLKEKDD